MELTVDRDKALAAAGKVAGVTVRATTIPILQHLLLSAQEGRLSIRAAEPEMQAEAGAEADVQVGGAITVPAGRFHDILKTLPAGGQLGLKLDGARLIARCGRSRFQLPTLPAADFPRFADAGEAHRATLPAKDLVRLIDGAGYAVSAESTRYYITGLHLRAVVGEGVTVLRAVATDGARLAYADVGCPEAWVGAPPITVPRKTVAELRRLVDGQSGDATLWTNGTLFGAAAGGGEIVSALIDSAFPDYARVIPRGLARALTVDVTELAAGLKRCDVFIAEKTRPVRLALEPGRLTLRSRDGEGGEAEEQVEIDYEGEPLELSFNARHLIELAGQMSGERLRLEFGGPNDPVKGLDPRDGGALHVLMPLRG